MSQPLRVSLCFSVLLAVTAPGHAQLAERWKLPPKPARTVVAPDQLPGVLTVKFVHDSGVRVVDSTFAAMADDAGELAAVLTRFDGSARAMFLQSAEVLDAWRASGELRTGKALHDLNLFAFVDAAPERVAEVCDALNALDIVELAWPATAGGDPVITPPTPSAPLGSGVGTPDFEPQQSYKEPAPLGIDAHFGNTFSGGRGIDVHILDCETGWTDDHEDLAGKLEDQFIGFIPANYPWNHGTAVMGEMLGEDNGFGVRGIAWEADGSMSTHTPQSGPQNIPASVANAAAVADAGDIIVVEIQCFAGVPAPHPCEYDPAIFATVETATANGVHVYAAAGNGGQNLDSSAYGGAFDINVRDSGAVLVGATDGGSLNAAGFSNFGSRVTSNGWGQDVTTAAYGDLQSGVSTVQYTSGFSGTSSATPIVTGAAAILTAMHREAYGTDLDPLVLRDLLATTGTAQGSGGNIGTRPDLRAAIRSLQFPEIEITQNTGAGGILEVTSSGRPNDTYLLLWSPDLLPTPLHLQPWGQLFINPLTVVILANGSLDASGSATDTFALPLTTSISGETTYFQGLQEFSSSTGTGSLANYVPFVVP